MLTYLRLEPYEGKLSSTVLRREGRSNPPDLADKSPEDTFSIPDFHKVIGYAYIYMVTEQDTVWETGTITIIRTVESRSALKYLKDQGYKIEKQWNEAGEVWAHEVEGYGIPIRIIQSEHLSEAGNVLLRHLRKGLDMNTLKKVLEEGEVYRSLRLLEAYLQVLLEANEEQFKEVRAMINSPVIERILKESGWIDKILEQDHQVWKEKLQKVEAENAELKEQLGLFQQAQAKPALGVPEQQQPV